MKKKLNLALVVDVENWAFDNIAKEFKKNLSNDFNISIIYMSKIKGNSVTMWLLLEKFDVVHFFCRGLAISYLENYFKNQLDEFGGDYELFLKKYVNGKVITTCVYDHLFLKEDFEFTTKLFGTVKNYTVSSNILNNIYNGLDIKYKPNAIITDGIDLDLFYPLNIDRMKNISNRKIVVGWVGNSEWCGNNQDYKGVNTILKPAIKELKEEGYNIELLTSDKIDKFIPHDQMVNYYSKIDLYACLSIAEGTPNPVLEAMACGVPVISTDVGIVRDALGKKQSNMILSERSVECLKTKIKELIDNSKLFEVYSKENLSAIKKWDWKYKSQEFKKFILSSYNNK